MENLEINADEARILKRYIINDREFDKLMFGLMGSERIYELKDEALTYAVRLCKYFIKKLPQQEIDEIKAGNV